MTAQDKQDWNNFIKTNTQQARHNQTQPTRSNQPRSNTTPTPTLRVSIRDLIK